MIASTLVSSALYSCKKQVWTEEKIQYSYRSYFRSSCFLKSRVSFPLNCTFLNFSYLQSQISIQLFWLLVCRITSGGGCSCPDFSLVPQLVISIIIISWSRLQSPPLGYFSSGSSYLGPLLFHGGAPKRFQKPVVMPFLPQLGPNCTQAHVSFNFCHPKD